jgi:hypothetical protein
MTWKRNTGTLAILETMPGTDGRRWSVGVELDAREP